MDVESPLQQAKEANRSINVDFLLRPTSLDRPPQRRRTATAGYLTRGISLPNSIHALATEKAELIHHCQPGGYKLLSTSLQMRRY
jgi:hypothetical protein